MFEERLTSWNIPFAVIADLSSGNAIRVGCSTGFEFDDLERSLFGDAERVLATGRSLEGQILPRTWSQGNVSCFVCKPNEHAIVGLFCSDQRSAVEKYHWSKQLSAEVAEAFAGA